MRIDGKNISAGYENKTIISNVNFVIEPGKITALTGANGSGKSTLLRVMANIHRFSGEISYNHVPVCGIDRTELAKIRAFLPQIYSTPSEMTVEELVFNGRYPYRRFGRSVSAEDVKKVNDSLCAANVEKLRQRRMGTLSGGERQRAWIAMTLAQSPKILLLDEPTAFLDIAGQIEMMELIKELNRKLDLTVAMVIHDLNCAVRVSHRILTVLNGGVTTFDNPPELMQPENLKKFFNIHISPFTGVDKLPYIVVS